MIRLGMRLTFSGGRTAIVRLLLIATAVGVGVSLLLMTLASLHALHAQDSRYAWLETGYPGARASAGAAEGRTDPLWWLLRADTFEGQRIGRVDVAATGPAAPVPPGIPALPGPGQFYASPRLAKLLAATPPDELAERFPGVEIGTIDDNALPAPDSLIIVVGRTVEDLSHAPGASLVDAISTTGPSTCTGDCALGVGIDANGMTLVLSIVVAALLFPVLIFIAGATRLSAAQREQRFAAMRLVGATPRQLAVIATVETCVATVAGVAAGFVLFAVFRPVLARIPFTGERFFTADLALSTRDVLAVVIGIPLAAAVAARVALRRVTISPLGVSRRVTPRPPRAWRLVPLLAGLGELAYFAYVHDIGVDSRTKSGTQAVLFLSGVVVTMVGLVFAGPWLTHVGSRLAARRAERPSTLIASRRLADDPKTCFRSISGVVVAVFVGSCAIGVLTTVVAGDRRAGASASSDSTLVQLFGLGPDGTAASAASARSFEALAATPGVTGVATIHARADHPGAQPGPPSQLIACDQLAVVPAFGHCPPGASTVSITPDYGGGALIGEAPMSDTTWPAADVSPGALASLPTTAIVVATDGTPGAVERARTVIDAERTGPFAPETLTEQGADNDRLADQYRLLANVVILASLPIAGCSLAVNVAGGLAERKRPFSLLRLTGTPLSVLRRVVIFETAVPLILAAAVAAGAGLLAAHFFVRAQLYESLHAPGLQYCLVVAGGLVLSLAVVASTFPLLRRVTGPEAARND